MRGCLYLEQFKRKVDSGLMLSTSFKARETQREINKEKSLIGTGNHFLRTCKKQSIFLNCIFSEVLALVLKLLLWVEKYIFGKTLNCFFNFQLYTFIYPNILKSFRFKKKKKLSLTRDFPLSHDLMLSKQLFYLTRGREPSNLGW